MVPPRISVALATYNGAKHLRAQLDSIAAQTLPPAEIVVGDDGSTDATFDILGEFSRTVPFPVRVQRNPTNLGYSDNFLAIASRCEAPFLAFCDQDDHWEPAKLERCGAAFADPDVMLVVHGGTVVDADLNPTGETLAPDLGARATFKHLVLRPQWTIHGMRMVIRTDLLRRLPQAPRPLSYEMRRPAVTMAHDRWTPFLAGVFGRCVLLPDRLIRYRQHGGNVCGVGAASVENQRLSNRLQMASATGSDAYRHWSMLALDCSRFLAAAARDHPSDATALLAASRVYASTAEAQEARARLYETASPLARLPRFVRMLAAGRYASRDQGGLGGKSMLKDALVAVRPR